MARHLSKRKYILIYHLLGMLYHLYSSVFAIKTEMGAFVVTPVAVSSRIGELSSDPFAVH